MEGMSEVERVWGVSLPSGLASLVIDARDACWLASGEMVRLPFPAFTLQQMVDAKLVAGDWEIADGLVPIMGDFHDLVCLDYRRAAEPVVILLDDDRNETALFDSFDEFFSALCVAPERTDGPIKKIVEKDSWLDF
ncbi:MAG: hypothetical protein EOP83_08845 [Verrucomicrobiaceae bacterium]|nr:MAG: hypothetical protein EOP83_08845 [Verrucomicrobiaceae bacterium]